MGKLSVSKYRRKDARSRRLGVDIYGTMGSALDTRNFPPGMHGPKGSPRLTEKGRQLNQKQRLVLFYNLKDKYFRKVLNDAKGSSGDCALNLLQNLERRLDVFLYRSKLAVSIRAAKQLISHGHIMVKKPNSNDPSRVDISSYKLKIGSKVYIKQKSKNNQAVLLALKSTLVEVPDYIQVDHEELVSIMVNVPKSVESVSFPFTVDFGLLQSFYI